MTGRRLAEEATTASSVVELFARDDGRAAIIAEPTQRHAGERDCVRHAVEAARLGDWTIDDLATRVRQCDEMAGEIAAIDRRDVFRVELTDIARIVPIVEMTAEMLEPFHSRQSRLQSLDHIHVPIQPKPRAAITDRR